jgi:hypothetical protein
MFQTKCNLCHKPVSFFICILLTMLKHEKKGCMHKLRSKILQVFTNITHAYTSYEKRIANDNACSPINPVITAIT